jgi:peptidoglycan/LPS O-acetylase OafA/YrhL
LQPVSQSRAADSANLDILRAMAVLYVVFAHTTHTLGIEYVAGLPVSWVGRLGVMFFFVHTCLVLMRSLERSSDKFSPFALSINFYIRRAFRIYPLSIVFVIAVVALNLTAYRTITALPEPYHPTSLDVISNILLTQNLTFSLPVMGVLWSLPVEVQMYIFLPPLFFLVSRLRSLWPLLLLWVLSIPIAMIQPLIVARAGLAQYVPHFLPGVMAYYLSKQMPPRISHSWWIPAVTTVSVLFLLIPSWQAGWVACLALGLMIPQFKETPAGWIRRLSGEIAKYSYGLYLCHSISIWLSFTALQSSPTAIRIAVYLVTLIGGPVLLYHWIEHPLIGVGVRLASRVRTGERAVITRAVGT